MYRNLLLSTVNILVIGLPIYCIWGIEVYIWFILLQIVLIDLVFWNIIGDNILIDKIFHGKLIPNNSAIKPIVNRYINQLASNGIVTIMESKRIVYSDSKIAFFIPISPNTFIVSLSLQDLLIKQGIQLLTNHIPTSVYTPQVMYSRKFLLLTLWGYKIMLKTLELWAIFFALAVKAFMSIGIIIATGAIYGKISDVYNAISLGSTLGDIILKINDATGYIQDRLVEFFVKETVVGSFNAVKQELSIK